ncbi:MAG: 30S ribosomal protein S8 [Nitrospirae bacterium]|nr:30S ribosomal protein S8 [Nitrospirota bacterium]
MVMTDPIADMLTRIRNASKVKFDKVDIPSSRIKGEIVKILKEEGFIKNYKFLKDKRQGLIRVYLKYTQDEKQILTGIKRVSTPGRRVYSGVDEIPHIKGGLGVAILSTPKGILTDKEARRSKIGGEILCYVW